MFDAPWKTFTELSSRQYFMEVLNTFQTNGEQISIYSLAKVAMGLTLLNGKNEVNEC